MKNQLPNILKDTFVIKGYIHIQMYTLYIYIVYILIYLCMYIQIFKVMSINTNHVFNIQSTCNIV